MNEFMKFTKAIDQFGAPIQLNYKSSFTLKTHLGGFFTIIALILGGIISYVFSKEIFLRDKPTTSFSKIVRNVSEVYFKDFPITVAINDYLGNPLPNPKDYFNIYGWQYVVYQNSTHPIIFDSYSNYTFQPCTNKSMGEYYQLAREAGVTSFAQCLDYNSYNNFYNDMSTMNSSFMMIYVDVCTNDTRKEGNWCASKTIIDNYINEFYVTTGFPDYIIDPVLYENYTTTFFHTISQKVSKGIKKWNAIKIKTAQVDTDEGWFQTDVKSRYFKQFEDSKLDVNLATNSGVVNNMYVASFESPRLGDVHSRTYGKIQLLLANIGGLMNIIAIACKLACEKVSEISFYLQESKSLLDFQLEEESNVGEPDRSENLSSSKNNIIIIPFEKKKIFNLIEQNSLENNVVETKLTKQNPVKSKEDSLSEQKMKKYGSENVDKIGFLGYLKAKLCCNHDENHVNVLYEKLIAYIKNELDISTIVKTKHDLELVKYLLIGKENTKLFDLKTPLSKIFNELVDVDNVLDKQDKNLENKDSEAQDQRKMKKSLEMMRKNFSNTMIFNP